MLSPFTMYNHFFLTADPEYILGDDFEVISLLVHLSQ
jgi:hypothetical protein